MTKADLIAKVAAQADSCGEILRRSGGQVCKPPPHPAGAVVSWPAGQPVPLERRRGRWAGLGEGKSLLQMP